MTRLSPLQGELQLQIMSVVWELGEASVEEVRSGLPRRSRGAYTTVQTVLNRLVERGLLKRSKRGRQMLYVPRVSEAEYLSQSIRTTLSSASQDARQVALAHLLGSLDSGELSDLKKIARQIERGRKG